MYCFYLNNNKNMCKVKSEDKKRVSKLIETLREKTRRVKFVISNLPTNFLNLNKF